MFNYRNTPLCKTYLIPFDGLLLKYLGLIIFIISCFHFRYARYSTAALSACDIRTDGTSVQSNKKDRLPKTVFRFPSNHQLGLLAVSNQDLTNQNQQRCCHHRHREMSTVTCQTESFDCDVTMPLDTAMTEVVGQDWTADDVGKCCRSQSGFKSDWQDSMKSQTDNGRRKSKQPATGK